MRKSLILSCLLCFVLAVAWGFRSAPRLSPTELYQDKVAGWLHSLDELSEALIALKTERDLKQVQMAYADSRFAYKQVAFLLAHLDPEGVKDYINGAPLRHLERKAPDMVILEPEGYQPLDEVLFGEAPLEEVAAIRHLVRELRIKAKRLAETHRYLRDHLVFHAIRKGLVSLFTLGLSGFDTPASGLALEDAKASLYGISAFLNLYEARIVKQQPALARELEAILPRGLELLDENPDFDSFDRLRFLKEIINPLYQKTLDVQQALGIELPAEVNPLPAPVNYLAGNLFAADFLNPWYFSKLPDVPQTGKRIELGQLLFYDPALSESGKMACASCHRAEHGFAEPLARSLASDGMGTVDRNSMSLINAVFATRYFHDLRTDQLSKQVEHVVFNKKEFNTNFSKIQQRLAQSSTYRDLFKAAYPRQPINHHTLASALAYYVMSLRSFNSPFDQYVRGERDELSEAARNGFNLFMGKAACATCHFPPTFAGLLPAGFSDSESEVLGVMVMHDTLNPVLDPDLGRYENQRPKEHAPIYMNSFKTPTVRNIAVTAPYMHNGAYPDLESVMDFYNRGGGLGMGLDLPHQTLPGDPLGLSEKEKADLIAFMKTLTDTSGLTRKPAVLPALSGGSMRKVK